MVRTRSFAAVDRERSWEALDQGVYDLLVIGAGITGSGIARDAAARGLRVALVDAGDIGGGTSSRSSRLIHGGLRYLETYDFDLVFEALHERTRLLELAPHLVRPLPFLFPIYRGESTGLAKLTAGMWLYEFLSLFRSPHRHRMLGRSGVLATEPNLRASGLRGGALYYDAQVDDARLTLAVARGAFEAGAHVVSHARVARLTPAMASVGTAAIVDALTGRTTEARARVLINATGPWSDRLRSLADPDAPPRLRPTKGVHLLFERSRVGNRGALIFRSIADGRVMFVLPWRDFTYVGTTDTEFEGDPSEVVAEAADVRYLLDSANAIFPAAKLTAADVISTWAGVRPLLAPHPAERLSASATSREHEVWRDPSGLLNIAGGKLTTFRNMAAETVDAAVRILREEFDVPSGDSDTGTLPLPGAPPDGSTDPRAAAGALGLPKDVVNSLVDRYGEDAEAVFEIIRQDGSLAEPVVDRLPYLMAEVVFAVRHTMALTLEDVLRRRVHVFNEVPDGGVSAAPAVAALMARTMRPEWTAPRIEDEVTRYLEAVRRNRIGRGDA